MPWLKWLPWRFFVRRLARSHGFLDPIALLSRLHRFAEPAEVAEPIELLRAGVVFHARGLINARVIQHNLDWVWPFWIERQFDPLDDAFVPRAFSITHVNLTHRNWTAVGLPDLDALPIVDPRGLLTPLYDGWSLDAWLLGDDGSRLLPSRAEGVDQRLDLSDGLAVETLARAAGVQLDQRVTVVAGDDGPRCRLDVEARHADGGWLVLALRPCNPEGVSFVHEVTLDDDRRGWRVDGKARVRFDQPAERHHVSDYRAGDVAIRLPQGAERSRVRCRVGMATAAALFRLAPDTARRLTVEVPLELPEEGAPARPVSWPDALAGACELQVPDDRYRFLWRAALHSLVLHAPGEVYPGPYTYKRFWFRDAAFIVHALLCAGLTARAERALARFPRRQGASGYFHSQEGEWDANGQVLWILQRWHELTGQPPPATWRRPIVQGARWIARKRLTQVRGKPHAGLLPAGFSAEHLGPNDYYYWDDFWGVAGLRSAAALCEALDAPRAAAEFRAEADAFLADIEASLRQAAARLGRPAMPASPYRRLDAGAIGSLAAGYPLQLWPADDDRLLDTVGFLLARCTVRGGFFQDMIHAGINAYLTLHMAQVLLRAGDHRARALLDTVAGLASPTGQWPEAIHPRTLGGCMGDGHHVWASAEWVLMVRHLFLREEGARLVLCQGIPPHWLAAGETLRFGPAPTAFGPLTVTVAPRAGGGVEVRWQAAWRAGAPPIELRLPGHRPQTIDDPAVTSVVLAPEPAP